MQNRFAQIVLFVVAAAFGGGAALVAKAAPALQQVLPLPASTVETLTFINVTFDISVTGVNAGDLLINGAPATSLLTVSDREYQFNFSQPATGIVAVAWAAGHGITDLASNAFAGGSWSYLLNPAAFRPTVIISEFMADNAHGIQDEDGTRADWIELYNPGPLDANLDGWFLTDNAGNPSQWRFPAVSLGVNKYLLVWASAKNRTNAAAPLHTNFKLAKSGGYLGLYDARTNVLSEFAPVYPLQTSDVSYGRDRVDPSLVGFFTTPTPGAQNSTSGTGFAPAPVFSLDSGVYTNATVTLTLASASGTIRYTLDGTLPTTNSAVYAGPMTFGTNATFRARVFQTNLWPGPVVARNYVFLDSTARDFNSNLPLLVMNTAGRTIVGNIAPSQSRVPGSVVLINTNATGRCSLRDQPEFQGLAGLEIFGQTSSGFPKKPYNIEVQDELGNDLAVSLLGLPAEADWKLRNPYSDKCMMNDFLGYELFEKMGHYSCRRRFVEVFVASTGGRLTYPRDYSGIEVLFERIERGQDRVDIAELTPGMTNEPNISGGYIFKKDKDSTGDLNFSTLGGGGFSAQTLKIHEPKARDLTTVQLAWLTNYLGQMERCLYAANWLAATGTNHYSYYLDSDSFVDQHWIVEFTKQIDGYRLSSYMQKDRNGRVKMEPIWDWNLSFGNANYLDGGHYSGWYYNLLGENDHIWLRRLITGTTSGFSTSGDPDFNQRVADRWSVLRTNVLNGTNVNARIDELAAGLAEAAVRDFAKFPRLGTYVWPNPDGPNLVSSAVDGTTLTWDVDYATPTSYATIISEMKKWVQGRYSWIDSQFTPAPTLNHPGGQISPGFMLVLTGPAGATIYYTLNGTDPRLPGGGIAPGASSGTGPISIPINANVGVVARAKASGSWNSTWSGPAAATLYTALPSLRITELMYNPEPPPPGSTNNNDDFEFVELKNTGTNTLNLVGFRLTNGVTFTFTATNWITSLAAGQRVLVVKNFTAFASRYPTATNRVAGEYTGNLNNGGEEIALAGPMGEPILDFTYDNQWYPLTDGQGFSLVVVDETAAPSAWTTAANWRASTYENGSPALPDPAPLSIPHVRVNELLNHPNTALGQTELVELYNPTTNSTDLSGWYLTDNASVPKKYRFPNGTVLAADDYLAITEAEFNPGGLGFRFSANGEEVWLLSADTNGVLTGYGHGFGFGAGEAGVSFGRYVNSQGNEDFVAQSGQTFGTNNALPLVGPVVINEIMYHPQALTTNDPPASFLELLNITATNVPLFHAAQPTNTWHLRNAVDFDFPTNVTLPPGGTVLVVGFDPATNAAALAAFHSRCGVATNVPIYGPWQGSLPNNDGAIELKKPDPSLSANPAYVMVDKVHYYDAAPWPCGTDGTGASLQRQRPGEYGNDPISWAAAPPTPGGGNTAAPPGVPVIAIPPVAQSVVNGNSANFTVSACGVPMFIQWLFNGTNLPNATNATLLLPNVQAANAGNYAVAVWNVTGSVTSTPALLTVLQTPSFLLQPLNQTVLIGSNTVLQIVVTGSAPVFVQWLFNGAVLPNATNSTLTLANVQVTQAGTYQARASNAVGVAFSDVATLMVPVPLAITTQPVGQSVFPYTSVSFAVTVSGSQPIVYQWRLNGTNLPNATGGSLQVSNVLPAHAGTYSVVITNTISAVTSAPALLNVYTNPIITSQPVGRSAAIGSNATFAVVAMSSTPLRYQWYFNTTNAITGATNDTLTFVNVQATNYGLYNVKVSDSFGSTWSDYAQMADKLKPNITQQPSPPNSALFLGATVALTISATGPQPLSYNWRRNNNSITNCILFDTTSIYTVTNLQFTNAGAYDVVVTNQAGYAPNSAKAYVTVMEPLTNQTAWAGSNVTFSFLVASSYPNTVTSNNNSLRYQWWFNETNLVSTVTNLKATFINVLLSLTNVQPANEGIYKVVLTNANGLATTQTAMLMLWHPPTISQQPTNQSVLSGGNAQFTVSADGTAPLSYQWWWNQTNLLPGATAPTLSLTSVQPFQASGYHMVITNAVGTVTSDVATLTVTIIQPPLFDTVLAPPMPGGPLQFGFAGQAGQSYTVLWREQLDSGAWQFLMNIPVLSVSQPVVVQDATAGRAQRFYRIVTPMQQ